MNCPTNFPVGNNHDMIKLKKFVAIGMDAIVLKKKLQKTFEYWSQQLEIA